MIHTIEATFEWQLKQILDSLHEDYVGMNFQDEMEFSMFVWKRKEELGQLFFEAINQWMGYDYLDNYNND